MKKILRERVRLMIAFREHLAEAFNSGLISKSELHRKTGISRSMIDRYLHAENPIEPCLQIVESIAEALKSS